MATYPRRSSYGVFVRFRRSKLALRRGIARLEEALEIAARLRADRFHGGGDVFVLKEPEGTVFELARVAPAPAPFASAPAVGPAADAPAEPVAQPATLATMPALPPAPEATRVEVRPRARLRPPPAWEAATILRMVEQADRFQETIDRARAAQARLAHALAATDLAIATQGPSPPATLFRSRARLGALIEGAARTMASCERAGALMARRVEAIRGAGERFDHDEGAGLT